MRTLAIGDIHGCHTALTCLLREVRPKAEDQVIFLGDYIDRGPASREVINTLLKLDRTCRPVFLRGNHEVMILEARADPLKARLWQGYGGLEALASYGAKFDANWVAAIPDSHWGFLERTARFHETDRHIFVHGGLDSGLDMSEQPDVFLFWEFFDQMKPHKSGKRIICGHTPQHSGEINDLNFAACIDTGAVRGGWLTCLDVESGQYWQANEKGETREGTLRE
jgi:serine/threonine protein phosphatase 1